MEYLFWFLAGTGALYWVVVLAKIVEWSTERWWR
jgi:hypothetical protein